MNSLLHVLNIGSLATWLSVAGFGVAGIALPHRQGLPATFADEATEAVIQPYDVTLGSPAPQDAEAAEGDGAGPAAPVEPPPVVEPPEAPPELPDLAELAPLPEIPNLPAPAKPQAKSTAAASRPSVSNPRPAAPAPSPRTGGGSGSGASGGQPGGSGVTTAARLAAGKMPAPLYPAAARRQGQTGTVLVEFTIDASGRVISAYAKSSSSWPLLDAEAIRTVRRWKFPPGPVMKLQRPITFQLR
jgi:periplasmic protein TonB